MTNSGTDNSLKTAYAWCLAWGEKREPKHDLEVLKAMREALNNGGEVPEEVNSIVKEVEDLDNLEFPQTLDKLKQLTEKHSQLWESKIGLVYGGATKVK
ncbi:MAG: type III-B CRISPR-associated protein Cas10/Cmr2, partial [Rivularia sp. (in: cyanobacteria)]